MSAKEQLIAPTIFVGSVVVGYKMYGKQSINSIHLYAASMWFGLTTWTSCIAVKFLLCITISLYIDGFCICVYTGIYYV